MIEHIVMCKLKPGHAAAELGAVMAGLTALVGEVAGFESFSHGQNIDLEGKSADVHYGFIGRFATQSALETYATYPAHVALGARLVALCEGGGAGIVVYDLKVDAK
ncbi:MAG: Dabb family protein [Rhodobacteraceae bacterium]|nr:Dabb family protein [Paracoccaceae bacterium]